MRREFRMPDAGEGLTEAEVLAWHVSPGDVVVVNQVLLEIETAKAAVELPSPYGGTVLELLVAAGDIVAVGEPIISIEEEGVAATPSVAPSVGPSAEQAAQRTAEAFGAPGLAATDAAPSTAASARATDGAGGSPAHEAAADVGPKREAVLVGYGIRAARTPHRRPRLGPHGIAQPEPGPPGAAAKPVRHGGLEQARAVEQRLAEQSPKAKPPVRRLARDLGVDLDDIVPTGPAGSITHDDVTRAAQRRVAPTPVLAPSHPGSATGPAAAAPPANTATDVDADRVPRSHVARMMARAMSTSAFTAPHVTEWVEVDATATTRLIAAARAHPQWAGLAVTPLTIAALGLVRAAREFPHVNASLDGEDLLVHRGVHLGVAVDSPRGLVVPHVHDADTLDLAGMAGALTVLIETARAGRSRPDQLRGSTITITNVGVFGVDGGTPILNPGESAILALGRVLPRPWVVDGAVVVRDVVTLALSFDHRVVDGALGSRVLRRVADFLEDPGTALALG